MKKTYLIAEQLQVAVKVEADSIDDAFNKYYDIYDKVFDTTKQSEMNSMYVEGGSNIRAYTLDSNGEFKDAE